MQMKSLFIVSLNWLIDLIWYELIQWRYDWIFVIFTILAHVTLAIINVFRTVCSTIARRTFARVVREMIDTLGTIFAWIEIRTKWYFDLTILTGKTRRTLARICFNAVNACAVIFAFVFTAIVNIHFTAWTSIAGNTIATEASFFKYGACSISAWIAIASINHELTMLSMIAWLANTLVLTFSLWLANCFILAWERETSITFR